jgi:hypothetical protein
VQVGFQSVKASDTRRKQTFSNAPNSVTPADIESSMGLRQNFRFKYTTASEVQTFLRSLSEDVNVEERDEFFVFTSLVGESFTFDCEILPNGLLSDRDGNYFNFFGVFIEALTGKFGSVEIEDA